MPGAVLRSGQWRIKPSSRLPIYLRFVINSSFTPEYARMAGFRSTLPNRTYLNHMMYWPAKEYDAFEAEITGYAAKKKGWLAAFSKKQLSLAVGLERMGAKLKKTDWSKKSNAELVRSLETVIGTYNPLVCTWYTQFPLDDYFESALMERLARRTAPTNPLFKRYLQISTDPHAMTEVAWERHFLLRIATDIKKKKGSLARLTPPMRRMIERHIGTYGYIKRGLATGTPSTVADIVTRLKELQAQDLATLLYQSSPKKLTDDYRTMLRELDPDPTLRRIIDEARLNSFMRNRRVEGFFFADYGASFLYAEIAKRTRFNPDHIMEVSPAEMIAGLEDRPMPSATEMRRRFKNYAMIVRNAITTLVSDPKKITELTKTYTVAVDREKKELKGMVACRGYAKGSARVLMNAREMSRMRRGDILVAQFTTPDFVPAMEKAAAIVTDQGGVSSHAAIVSRELGVPCVIGTQDATRVIKDGDMIEVDAEHGVVRIL